ncbi:hypothetical protein [Sphingomonas sp. 1P08PE]|uniref:hypothetical protein n=1 Tax=Sphingomonas sp. 1P08PE TaxID=554122 RepID=UPI0039A188DC
MTQRERIKVELAVTVLRQTMAKDADLRSEAVRLALRVIWPHCRERWPLVSYWEAGGNDHEIGRRQSMTAAFNGIVHQLRQAGAYRG